MKEPVTKVLVASAPGLGAALAGAPWWVVVTLVCVVIGLTCLMVYVLTRNPRTRRIQTFLITWDASGDPEEPPDTS